MDNGNEHLLTELREGVLILPASQFGYSGNHFRLGYGRRDMPEGLAKLESLSS